MHPQNKQKMHNPPKLAPMELNDSKVTLYSNKFEIFLIFYSEVKELNSAFIEHRHIYISLIYKINVEKMIDFHFIFFKILAFIN